MKTVKNPVYDKLVNHVGHNISCVRYGTDVNVTIECEDCQEVLVSEDKFNDIPTSIAEDFVTLVKKVVTNKSKSPKNLICDTLIEIVKMI